MPITPTNPIEVTAKPALVCDKVWLVNLHILAPTPTAKVRMGATLIPYSSVNGETAGQDREVRINSHDLFELASNVPEVATAMDAVLHALEVVAKLQGKI